MPSIPIDCKCMRGWFVLKSIAHGSKSPIELCLPIDDGQKFSWLMKTCSQPPPPPPPPLICGMQQTKSFKLYMFICKRQAWDLSRQSPIISPIIYQHFQSRNLCDCSALLRSSTRMRLPILNSVRAWARLFHVSASRGLDLSQQSPNRRKVGLWNSLVGGGRRYVTLAKWVTEVGHWPPSSLGNFSVIKETYFCGANCVALLQCELLLRQLHVHIRYIKHR